MAKKYLDGDGLLYFWQKIKSAFVTDITYDSTNRKIQKKKNGSSSDVVTLASVATSGSYNDLSNKPTIPSGVEKSTTTPKMDGTASVGSETKFAAGDHVHPTDTSRQADLGLTSNDVTKWNNAIGYGYNSHTPEAYVRGFDEDTERDIVSIKHGTTTSIDHTDIPTKAYVDGALDNASIQVMQLLNGKVNADTVGAASGVCPLDANSKVDSQYLPSYVDDVIEAYPVSGATALSAGWLSATSGGSALTPEAGKIYVLMADSGDYSANTQFRWGGTAYVKLADGGVSSITNSEIDTIVAS